MKAQELTAFCSAVLFVLAEAMLFGGDVAASAQGVPQQNSFGAGNSAMSGDFGNGRRRGRHKKHRKHRGGRRKHGMNRMGETAARGGIGSDPWNQMNNQGGNWQNGMGGGGKRHKRHRGGRKRRMMQMNGAGGGAGMQSGGRFGN